MKFPLNSLGQRSCVSAATALIALLVFPPSGNVDTEQSRRQAQRLGSGICTPTSPHAAFRRNDVAVFRLVGSASAPDAAGTPDEDDWWSSLITVCRAERRLRRCKMRVGEKKRKTKSARQHVGKNVSKPPKLLLRFFGPFVRCDLARKLELKPSVTKRFEFSMILHEQAGTKAAFKSDTR